MLMTSYANFSSLKADNLTAVFRMSNSQTSISARLKEFKISDASERTRYRMIAESTDSEVFDVNILLNNNLKDQDKVMGVPDVVVKATMCQLRFVFLMKYVRDLLDFIDPFTNMKEYVMELSAEASERTISMAKVMRDFVFKYCYYYYYTQTVIAFCFSIWQLE